MSATPQPLYSLSNETQTWRPISPGAGRHLPTAPRPPRVDAQHAGPGDLTWAYAPQLEAIDRTRVVTPMPAPEPPSVDDAWVEFIAHVERSRLSDAEASWSAMQSDGETAVWDGLGQADHHEDGSAAHRNSPTFDEMMAETRVEFGPSEDTARHEVEPLRITPAALEHVMARPPHEVSVVATAEMAAPRAALLLQLAPTGYAGCGTPIDAAVVPRGRLLDVGRDCHGPWANDPYLDSLHARLLTDAEGLRLIDPGSRGGVWLRLEGSCWLRDGDWFRIGEQFFAFDGPDGTGGPCGSITLVDCERRFGEPIQLDEVTVLGRNGDVSLVHDPYVSGAHCRTLRVDEGVLLEDLDSSNGTWVRLRSGDAIPFGSVVAIGRSLYFVDAAEQG